MSTNVKMAGYYIKLETLEEAKNCYKALQYTVIDSMEDEFVDDNYDELFYNKYSECLNKWIPYYDYEGNYGVIYLLQYEYDAFTLDITFDGSAPILFGTEGIPFATLYYNGADCPLKFK